MEKECYYMFIIMVNVTNNRLDVKSLVLHLILLANTIIDGEYITKNIINKPIKIFAVSIYIGKILMMLECYLSNENTKLHD
jgi:hypothetical protein